MAMAFKDLQMVTITKDNTKMEDSMEKENTCGQTVQAIKEILQMAREMETESGNHLNKMEICILENIILIRKMVMDVMYGRMDAFIKGISKMI